MPKIQKQEQFRTQNDKVLETLGDRATEERSVTTEKLQRPGIRLMSLEEKAELFTTIMKSRRNLISFTYNAGDEFIEITSESDMSINR